MRAYRPNNYVLFALAVFLGSCLSLQASAQGFLKRFAPVKRVEVDASADYTLTDTNGPWLVMASTFSGDGAEEQARELVQEFRQRFNLPAYIHDMQFKLEEKAIGRGVDKYGAPIKMKYRRGNQLHEWAVLVGDFPSIDDPRAQKLLKTVKTLKPTALNPNAREQGTTQALAGVRAMQVAFVERLGKSKDVGPMRAAFLTRNPVLPDEYFVPKGVDKFVERMNSKVEHSLLDNKSKFTVKVATFRGKGILTGAANAPKQSRKQNKLSPLEEAALHAHLLTEEMRRVGWEAYEFHDRHESIVAVGGYDKANPGSTPGTWLPTREMLQTVQTFGARFNTPADPLQQAKLPMQVQAEAQQRLQQFNQRFSSEHGQIAGGMTPKFARIPPKARNAEVIPFDIHPTVIEVPKTSISAGFAWSR